MSRINLQRVLMCSGPLLCCVYGVVGCAPNQNDTSATAASVVAAVDEATDEDANAAIAAGVPSTDIVLVSLKRVLDRDEYTPAKEIVRRRGYDNQPSFSADGQAIWFSSILDGEQADVYRYDIRGGDITRITNTPESEYSPTPLKQGGFSCIQVALDGSQRLWRYDDAGKAQAAIRADVTGVGYHAWIGPEALALFIVDEPVRLELVKTTGDARETVATNIGRALHYTARGTLGYVQKNADNTGTVNELDVASGQSTRRAQLPAEGEDLVWLADGSALTANGRTVYRLAPEATTWQPVVNLARSVHGDISRMAVDPQGQWLALVVSESEG